MFYYTARRVVHPAASVAPPVELIPPHPPELPHDIPDPLPIIEEITLDDVVLDTHSSDRPHELSSSDDNSDAFVVSNPSVLGSESTSSTFVRF